LGIGLEINVIEIAICKPITLKSAFYEKFAKKKKQGRGEGRDAGDAGTRRGKVAERA
jgi:hypothetical protein